MKCDEKLVRLEETYGDWVKQEKENCRLSSGAMTKELYPYQALFSPIQVNKTMIKNRVVMGPMGNLNMCEESGRPNDKMLQYFFARAKGGTGLLTTGLIPVSHGIDPTVTEVDDLSLFPGLIMQEQCLQDGEILHRECMLMEVRFLSRLHQVLEESGLRLV